MSLRRWSGQQDLNLRPEVPKIDLTGCPTYSSSVPGFALAVDSAKVSSFIAFPGVVQAFLRGGHSVVTQVMAERWKGAAMVEHGSRLTKETVDRATSSGSLLGQRSTRLWPSRRPHRRQDVFPFATVQGERVARRQAVFYDRPIRPADARSGATRSEARFSVRSRVDKIPRRPSPKRATPSPSRAWQRAFLEEVEQKRKPATLELYRGYLDRYVTPDIGRLSADDRRPGDDRQASRQDR